MGLKQLRRRVKSRERRFFIKFFSRMFYVVKYSKMIRIIIGYILLLTDSEE